MTAEAVLSITGGSIQFLKKWKIHDLDAYFWTIITC